MRKRFLPCLTALMVLVFTHLAFGALADLIIDRDSITLSKTSPMEGDDITISAEIINAGNTDVNEDIEVRFVEGDPAKGGLQISSDAIVLGLKAGATGKVQVKWRAAPGKTDIYVIVNPDNAIKESNTGNNTVIKTVEGQKWKGRKVSEKEIKEAVKNGLEWLRSQQGEFYVTCPNGHDNFLYAALAYGKCVICGANLEGIEPTRLPPEQENMPGGWMAEIGAGMTSLAVMTFLHAGFDESDPAVSKGIYHLLNNTPVKWDEWTEAYDHAVAILALTATGNKEEYQKYVEHFTKSLVALQTEEGGWGYGRAVADAAHLQYVIFGLYAAKQWGIEIPTDTWTRAVAWLTNTQRPDGGWNYYTSGAGPFAEDSYGSMTATAIMALKAAGIPPSNDSIQRGLKWLNKYYSVTRNPGSFYWHYYYLVAVQRAMDMPPAQEKLGNHDWYHDMASLLLSRQREDGSWLAATPIYATSNFGQTVQVAKWGTDRGDIMATCFALLFLMRAMPESATPDVGLAPEHIIFSKADPADSEEITVTASVSNASYIPVENLQVSFYDGKPDGGGVLIGSAQTLPALAGGETKQASVKWKATGAGEHKIYAVIDPSNALRESDENNNVAFGKIIVGGESQPAIPAMTKVGDGLYKLGEVDLDLNKKTLTMYGKVNMSYGLIELLACTKIGKLHESALIMDVQPIHLQTGLILLGLEYEGGLSYQGDPRTPKGDRVRIWVEWDNEGQTERHRAEDLVYNREKDSPMEHMDWVFTGSRMNSKGVFTAQAVGTLITTFHDPDTIIDNPLPEGADDTVYIVNSQVVPPKGTSIKMIITPANSG